METSTGPDPDLLEAPSRPSRRAADVREGSSWTRLQRLKNDAIYAVVLVALVVVLRLPRRAVAGLCRALGAVAYRLLCRERAAAEARLAAGLGADAVARRARDAFLTAAAMLADTLALFDPR